jgi:hypothetical protein
LLQLRAQANISEPEEGVSYDRGDICTT